MSTASVTMSPFRASFALPSDQDRIIDSMRIVINLPKEEEETSSSSRRRVVEGDVEGGGDEGGEAEREEGDRDSHTSIKHRQVHMRSDFLC